MGVQERKDSVSSKAWTTRSFFFLFLLFLGGGRFNGRGIALGGLGSKVGTWFLVWNSQIINKNMKKWQECTLTIRDLWWLMHVLIKRAWASVLNYCWLGHAKDHGKWFVPTSLTLVTLCVDWHSIAGVNSHAMNVEGRLSLGWDEQGEMDTGGAAELREMVERLADILWEAVLFWWKGLRIIFWQRHRCRERPSVYGKSRRQNRHFLREKGNYFFSWEWDSVRILPCHRLPLSLPL